MNPDWQNFLIQQGATIEGGVAQHFGDQAAELNATAQTTVLCDLSQFGTLRVSGIDAQSFLQNLLSNDILEVSATRAQLSSLNTAKGRMLATMLIWQTGTDYYLQLPRGLCAAMQKKLSMYVLRAKVKIEDASMQCVCIGISGTAAKALLKEHVGPPPDTSMFVTHCSHMGIQNEYFTIICLGDYRFQIITLPQHAPALWQKFSAAAHPAGSACWDWLNIRSGNPTILPQTQEHFVAQMVNFELIGGVNFKKGCYPGQEIVARMQYLGTVKRRMYLAHMDFHLDSSDAPQAGDELCCAIEEGQACGMIVNAAPAPGGGYDVLATVQISSRETQTVHWKSLQGEALQFLPQPYPLA